MVRHSANSASIVSTNGLVSDSVRVIARSKQIDEEPRPSDRNDSRRAEPGAMATGDDADGPAKRGARRAGRSPSVLLVSSCSLS